MASIRSTTLSGVLSGVLSGALAAGLLCGALSARTALEAAPDDAKPAKGGAYSNQKLGVSARSPSGWKMVVDRGVTPSSWTRLVTFNDKATDAQAVLSVRPRAATSVEALMAGVRRAWDKSRDRLRVDSMKKIESSALEPIGKVIVSASFTRQPKPKPAKDGVAPPPAPPVTYKVRATYLLGPSHEYLLYAQGQKTHWSRLRDPLRQLSASIRFTSKAPPGAKGVGSYRSDADGFSCRFPKDYTVVRPQRANHVVKFEGVGAEDPILSVYAFSWEESAEKDAARLVTHYEEDKGGTASTRTREVAGQEAVLVTAEASLGGEDRTILIAVLKRGDTCFRLRASMPQGAKAAGTAVFNKFMDGFQVLGAPK